MIDDELVPRLVALGLTHNESRVLLYLIRSGEVTAGEAADGSGVPRQKVYEALRALEGRGFCVSASGRVSRYRPTDIEAALESWLRHRDIERAEAAERDREHVAVLERELPSAQIAPVVAVPDFIEGVSGRLPTTDALEDLMARAQRSLVELLQPPFIQPRARWNIREVEALDRGVDVRIVYTPEAIEDPRRCEDLVRRGAQLRVVDRLPMKLLVRDDEEALISLREAATGAQSATSAVVRHPDLVAPLRTLFDEVWAQARPIDA